MYLISHTSLLNSVIFAKELSVTNFLFELLLEAVESLTDPNSDDDVISTLSPPDHDDVDKDDRESEEIDDVSDDVIVSEVIPPSSSPSKTSCFTATVSSP